MINIYHLSNSIFNYSRINSSQHKNFITYSDLNEKYSNNENKVHRILESNERFQLIDDQIEKNSPYGINNNINTQNRKNKSFFSQNKI